MSLQGVTPYEHVSDASKSPRKIEFERLLNANDVRAISAQALAASMQGRLPESWRRELEAMDRSATFSTNALRIFQDLQAQLGIPTQRPILLPMNSQPFWHRGSHPFANYQSTIALPCAADVAIIGAGLTGVAAAYRLKDTGLRVVLLDQGDPACEASGRNGGNFELLPENSVGIYEGLAPGRFAFMQQRYPHVPMEVLQAVSERQASLVLGLALKNRDILKKTILDEGILCDFSPRGWLHIATNESEEQGICDEVSLAAQHGQQIAIWSRGKIAQEFGIDAAFLGRFIPGDGTYHPFKYVCGELRAALRDGVALYTRTKVRSIVSVRPNEHRVLTDRGEIVTAFVVVATNAFTRELLPELSAIEPYQSQIIVTEHVPDRARGRIVTSDNGPVFFNQPREGAVNGHAPLLMGGGDDRRMKNPSSRRRSPAVHARLLSLRDSFYPELVGQPPSAEWVGPMAFTPDGLPCIGFLRPGLIVTAGYNGYGGSYTTAAGHAAAEMAMTNVVPDWLPEEIFSPRRLVTDEPLFLTERKGLWRVAAALCQQIQNVNRKLSEALTLQQPTSAFPASSAAQILRPAGESRLSDTLEPETLRAFDAFKKFSPQEIGDLLRLMRRWDLTKDTIIFTEGSPGGTCFIILEGAIDVSINAHGQQQLLTTLDAGAVFGQMSLIEGVPRSATCSVRSDAVLLEIERGPCEELFHSGSTMALKFLATLNEGLISALRGADLRLMQLDRAQFQRRPAETPRVGSASQNDPVEDGAGAGAFITVSDGACAP
jgi:glycine/D-amino acid oxidase-like deaminating enzyme/CRP-like cAMP-binding protein